MRTLCSVLMLSAACMVTLLADNWPQWLGPRRDSVWRETGIVATFPANGPKIRWRVPIGGGFAGPAVADGRVYVMDRQRPGGTNTTAGSGDKSTIPGGERVLCLNERDGQVVWQHVYDCPYSFSYPAGPRSTPLVAGGRVFTVGAEGNLFCLDTATGRVLWSRDFKKDFGARTPTWGFAGNPLLSGDRLLCLVGGDHAVVVAFAADSGRELWRALSAKEPGYGPPTPIERAGRSEIIVWHAESVNALRPETGEVLWSFPFGSRFGLTAPTPRLEGDILFVTAFYEGSLALRLGSGPPDLVWRSKKASEVDTDGLHSIISTPFIENGYVYGVCSYGQLRCLKLDTGERVWETLAATTADNKKTRWANAFIVKNGDRFLLCNERGDLIIAGLSPAGYEERSRCHLLDPTNTDPGRAVVWSHPAFANQCIYARNDREIVCASLAAE